MIIINKKAMKTTLQQNVENRKKYYNQIFISEVGDRSRG